jgi:hypothetical protein
MTLIAKPTCTRTQAPIRSWGVRPPEHADDVDLPAHAIEVSQRDPIPLVDDLDDPTGHA